MTEAGRNPKSPEAWGWLGALFWAYDFRPEAQVCLRQAEKLDPVNPRWPYFHGLSLIIATPDQAIPFLRKTVALCGDSPEAPRYRLARLLAEQGRWEEARAEYDALLKAHPDFKPAILLAARAAQAGNRTDEALKLTRDCLDDARTRRSAHILLATLLRIKGDIQGATQALERSTTLPTDDGFGDPYEAEGTLLRGDPRALAELAHPLLAAGRLNEAGTLIERLRREHATFPETWLLIGRLHLLKKQLPEAEQALRYHVEMDPRSVQGQFQLGLALLAREQFDAAASTFAKATELKPDFGPAWYNRGFALGRLGKPREAITCFQESLRHNPERLDTYLLLADLYLRLGERQKAGPVLDQAEAIKPGDPRIAAVRDRVGRMR